MWRGEGGGGGRGGSERDTKLFATSTLHGAPASVDIMKTPVMIIRATNMRKTKI